MAMNEIVLPRGTTRSRSEIEPRVKTPARKARASLQRKKIARPSSKILQPVSAAKAEAPGSLPILYMLSPQKFMSPFDCNMAADSGYKIVLPYDNVTVSDVTALVQDAIFSRPPNARTGFFIGGKDITLALDMMAAARKAMVTPFEVSVFADPGGSYTTAAAMVACVERVLKRQFRRGLKDLRVAVFGATGVVGFVSGVIAAREGAHVRIVAHDTLEPLIQLGRNGEGAFRRGAASRRRPERAGQGQDPARVRCDLHVRPCGRQHPSAQAFGSVRPIFWSLPTSMPSRLMASRAWSCS